MSQRKKLYERSISTTLFNFFHSRVLVVQHVRSKYSKHEIFFLKKNLRNVCTVSIKLIENNFFCQFFVSQEPSKFLNKFFIYDMCMDVKMCVLYVLRNEIPWKEISKSWCEIFEESCTLWPISAVFNGNWRGNQTLREEKKSVEIDDEGTYRKSLKMKHKNLIF